MPKVTIGGLEKLLNNLRKAEQQLWPTVMRVIDKYVDLMVADARQNAPVDLGVARDSIGKEVKDRAVVFHVASAHGAIQEFGFGAKMGDIPPELESEALKFKGYKSGDFKEFVKELEEWCARKGIDTEAAYPIAVSILNNGLAPQPFFYPAYQKYKPMMLKEIDTEVQKLLNI